MDNLKQKISLVLLEKPALGSSDIHQKITESGVAVALVTVKRALTKMKESGLLESSGVGRAITYSLTWRGRLLADIDPARYCEEEPDKRYGAEKYNFELFNALTFDHLSDHEKSKLADATSVYLTRIKDLSPALHKKELERFVIELSWKSSRIEGNTYTLLDTEKLILEGIVAPGHSQAETQMILNHKDAFAFIREHQAEFQTLTKTNLEAVHRLIVKDMGVTYNLRTKPVGIVGSRYRPLDNTYQLAEALDQLMGAVERMADGYAKALIALLGVSYLQPFEDGNKRTSRLIANALLLAHNLAPLSYRNVDEKGYREAMLVFYELNSLVPFKKIFAEQYDFAAKNYLVN